MSPIIVREDLPDTPDWAYAPRDQAEALAMPLLWQGDDN